MLVKLLRRSSSEITHIVLAALGADLQVSISMQLGDFLSGYPTFSMQTVNILANNVFEIILFHKLTQSHVGYCGNSLHSFNSSELRWFVCKLLQSLVLGALLLPLPRACWQDSIFRAPVIWNSS